MLFSSIPFLYVFLPIVLILYAVAPKSLKNTVLLLSGIVFYAWGEPRYVFLMMFAIILSYIFGLLIEKSKGKLLAKILLVLNVSVNLGMLAYFKYADFFISNFNTLFALSIPLLRIALPIGISFYTFQILSYTVDVYRGTVPAQRNIVSLGAYVVMFPQLIAGPIVRYSDVAKALNSRTHTLEKTAYGVRRFILGLSKKILIANALGELCDIFRSSDDKTVLYYWLYAIAFTLHIYFDFSGYSDMAIGLGKLFGFTFMENFDYPYISRSVTEFWRRWHRSLGQWFRDYVYIPLGGNRTSKLKHIRNIFVVWLLTGFWHGAAWNFVVWGIYFAILLIIEKFWLFKYLSKSKILSRIYTLFLVVISFVIFNANDMSEAFSYIGAMFGAGGINAFSAEVFYYLKSYAVVLIIGIIGATPIPKKAMEFIASHKVLGKVVNLLEPIALTMLLIVITAYLVDSSFNPFLYFRF